jgi:hypothetical protein
MIKCVYHVHAISPAHHVRSRSSSRRAAPAKAAAVAVRTACRAMCPQSRARGPVRCALSSPVVVCVPPPGHGRAVCILLPLVVAQRLRRLLLLCVPPAWPCARDVVRAVCALASVTRSRSACFCCCRCCCAYRRRATRLASAGRRATPAAAAACEAISVREMRAHRISVSAAVAVDLSPLCVAAVARGGGRAPLERSSHRSRRRRHCCRCFIRMGPGPTLLIT